MQLKEGARIAEHDVPAGYVNATQMCQACSKKFNDYARLESTKEYLEGFSRYTGIPVDLLIITITTGKNHYRGTWTHPEIAIDLAKWVSVDFRIWANQVLRQVISGQVSPVKTVLLQPETPHLPTPQEISELLDLTLGKTDLDKNLIAGVKLNAIVKYYPSWALVADTAKSSLVVPVESELLSPTQLAHFLTEKTGTTWTNRMVNKTLLTLGFQEKNPEGNNPAYLPTGKGKKYGQIILNTARGRDKTVQSLRWYKEIMEVIEC